MVCIIIIILLGQITISNARSKRVNKNINTFCIPKIKSLYIQIFMFISVSVSNSIAGADNDQ